MSMTLEEAIKHAEEVSNKCQNFVTAHKEDRELEFIQRTGKCAEEHRQLAEWLKELKERRKLPEIIRCKECENWDTTWQNDSAPNYHYCPLIDGTYSGDFYCAKAERRTE